MSIYILLSIGVNVVIIKFFYSLASRSIYEERIYDVLFHINITNRQLVYPIIAGHQVYA